MRIVYFIILFKFVWNCAKNQGLTNSLNEISDMNNVLGAKNLLPNNAVSQTISGVTLTKNSDGTVNVHGTNSSAGWINHNICETSELKKILGAYKGKKLILSTTKDYDYDTNNINLHYNIGGNERYIVPAPKEIEFTVPNNIDSAEEIFLVIGTNAGATANVDNMGIMIRPASIQDDTYVPYSMTNREMTPYVQSISNPNLLDNPWFTVNQREFTTTTSSWVYVADRWMTGNVVTGSVTKESDDTLTITGNTQIEELIEESRMEVGKTYTYSAMLYDNSIISETFVLPAQTSSTWQQFVRKSINSLAIIGAYNGSNISFWIEVEGSATKRIKAAKLELGSVSTLSMDTAPNYQQELAKCQRYFYRYKAAHTGFYFGLAIAWNTNKMSMILTVPCMRSTATITPSDFSDFLVSKGASSVSPHNITNFENLGQSEQNHASDLLITTSESDLTSGDIYVLKAVNSSAYIDFSADL